MSNVNDIDEPSFEEIAEYKKHDKYMKSLICLGNLENKYKIPDSQRITVYEEVGNAKYPFPADRKTEEDVIKVYQLLEQIQDKKNENLFASVLSDFYNQETISNIKSINQQEDLKIETLKMMDNVARKINDEEVFEYWLINGVPDGATNEDYADIVKDNDFNRIEKVFKILIHEAVKDGLYKATDEELKFAQKYESTIQNIKEQVEEEEDER